MDYEKKYKEALERASELLEQMKEYDSIREDIEYVFPELKENEDEYIRKRIIHALRGDVLEFNEITEAIAWLEKQGEPKDKGEISDGYHTFNELYEYRKLYNAAFFNLLPKHMVYKSKKHHDGEECFGGGWFIVMANLPTGQISNHYELKDWDLFKIPERDVADEWDGHTPQDAADRLHEYLLEKQSEKRPADKVEQGNHPRIVMADFTGGEGFYKLNLDNLNEEQVFAIEIMINNPKPGKKIDADKVIEWLVANILDYEYFVKLFKKDFGL